MSGSGDSKPTEWGELVLGAAAVLSGIVLMVVHSDNPDFNARAAWFGIGFVVVGAGGLLIWFLLGSVMKWRKPNFANLAQWLVWLIP